MIKKKIVSEKYYEMFVCDVNRINGMELICKLIYEKNRRK